MTEGIIRAPVVTLQRTFEVCQSLDSQFTAQLRHDGSWTILPCGDLPLPDVPVGMSKTGRLYAVPTLPSPSGQRTAVDWGTGVQRPVEGYEDALDKMSSYGWVAPQVDSKFVDEHGLTVIYHPTQVSPEFWWAILSREAQSSVLDCLSLMISTMRVFLDTQEEAYAHVAYLRDLEAAAVALEQVIVPRQLIPAAAAALLDDDTAVRGITNLGNTCYLGATLQGIAATPALRDHLLDPRWSFLPANTTFGVLRATVEDLLTPNGGPLKPERLHLRILKKLGLGLYKQEDPDEVLNRLNICDCDDNPGVVLPSLFDVCTGYFTSEVMCPAPACKKTWTRPAEPFSLLELSIAGVDTLQQALAVLTANDHTDAPPECGFCGLTPVRGKVYEPRDCATVRHTIRAPENMSALLITLKRFPSHHVKDDRHIFFPMSFEYDFGGTRKLLDLCAIVVHHGPTRESGHYVALTKRDGHWWLCDDKRIRKVTSGDVLSQRAYMLYYSILPTPQQIGMGNDAPPPPYATTSPGAETPGPMDKTPTAETTLPNVPTDDQNTNSFPPIPRAAITCSPPVINAPKTAHWARPDRVPASSTHTLPIENKDAAHSVPAEGVPASSTTHTLPINATDAAVMGQPEGLPALLDQRWFGGPATPPSAAPPHPPQHLAGASHGRHPPAAGCWGA